MDRLYFPPAVEGEDEVGDKSEEQLAKEAEEIAQKLPDPPKSDPAEVEEEKKKKAE